MGKCNQSLLPVKSLFWRRRCLSVVLHIEAVLQRRRKLGPNPLLHRGPGPGLVRSDLFAERCLQTVETF